MPNSDQLDLQSLASMLNAKGDDLKRRRARIDALIDADLDKLTGLFKTLDQ